MNQHCDLCGDELSGWNFRRGNYAARRFCSIRCVEVFETRTGLPSGRIYESRPGWSPFPAVQPQRSSLPC